MGQVCPVSISNMAVLESITATRALGAVAVLALVQFAVKLHKARMLSREAAEK